MGSIEAGPNAVAPQDDAERAEHERAALESDARHERMDRVAVLFGEITAATREFLRALAESDRHEDWAAEGFGSCAEWLAWRIGVTRDTAGEKVRAARALERLPLISEAMGRGQISFSKVRALTRAATPENEGELLEYARACSAASLERLVRGWKTLGRLDEARAERLRHHMRSFSVFPSHEGMYVVKGLVKPEVGALLMRAIEAASEALFAPSAADDGERAEPAQLRADALALVAERALAAGFGGAGASRTDREAVGRRVGNGGEVAGGEVAGGEGGGGEAHVNGAPISGTRAARYQVVLHVEPETLREHGEPGMSELEDGTRLSAESARRITCDSSLATVVRGPGGYVGLGGLAGSSQSGRSCGSTGPDATDRAVLDAGRRTRTVPPAVRRALEARDRGCRFPGCGLRFTDAHHVVHWADGGQTSLANMLLLCARHHRAVHEGGFRVCTDREGRAVFFGPSGRVLADAPPVPDVGPDAAKTLVGRNRERGVEPDWRSGMATYRYDGAVPWEIQAAALEAMDEVLDLARDPGTEPPETEPREEPDAA